MTTASSYPESSRLSELADDAARQASHSTQHSLERAAESLGSARAQTSEALRHLAHDTEALAHRGLDAVRDKSLHVRETTTHYIQDEPVKSMLIAAAVGAALMGLVAMFSRNSHPASSRSERNQRSEHNGYRTHH